MTAKVAVRYGDRGRGTPRQARRRDVAVARQLLRTHYRNLLGSLDPADTHAARDVLCASKLPQDSQPGWVTLVRDVAVGLNEAAKQSLADYDAGTRGVYQRQQSMVMRIAVVRDVLGDPVSSLAWFAGREPGSIAPKELEACLTHLEEIAKRIRSEVSPPQPEANVDPIVHLLTEYVESIPQPIQRYSFLGKIARMWDEADYQEFAQRARALLPAPEVME